MIVQEEIRANIQARRSKMLKRRKLNGPVVIVLTVLTILGVAYRATADVNMRWVRVGDPHNAGELSGAGVGGFGPDRVTGAVTYVYYIGMYEITNIEYVEFLNAVASTADTYGLYNQSMADLTYGGIFRNGSLGSYTYEPIPGHEEWPVNYVSWYDAIRFANWMTNTSGQGAGGTESGSYAITGGGVNSGDVSIPTAEERAAWTAPHVVLTSEDEWYKAAFYKGGGTNAGYWDYATQSDTVPTAEPPPGGNNSANYTHAVSQRTPVGAYSLSDSYYGAFDQNGNVLEWLETANGPSYRFVRGGSYATPPEKLASNYRTWIAETYEDYDNGFRVSLIGEVPPLLGDLNGDGFVGNDDLDTVLVDWGHSPPILPNSDPSGDGSVGQDDLDIVLTDWGRGIPPEPVPEPATLSLLTLGGLAVIRRRGR